MLKWWLSCCAITGVVVAVVALLCVGANDSEPLESNHKDSLSPNGQAPVVSTPTNGLQVETIPFGREEATDRNDGHKGSVICGWIFDDRNEPVCGAIVTIRRADLRGESLPRSVPIYDRMSSDVASDVSKPDGSFWLEAPKRGLFDLSVTAKDYATEKRGGIASGDVVRVSLSVAGGIAGTLAWPKGVVRETVWASVSSFDWLGLLERHTCRVSESGHFNFDSLSPNIYTVSVSSRTYPPSTGKQVTVAAGRVSNANVELEEGLLLRGKVLRREVGTPIPGVRVRCVGERKHRSLSGPDGRFCIRVSARRDSWAIAFSGARVCEEQRVVTKRDAKAEVEIELIEGWNICGTAMDDQGAPVENAMVALLAASRSQEGLSLGQTQADGRFRLESVRLDISGTLLIRTPGGRRRSVYLPPQPKSSPREIELGEIVIWRPAYLFGFVKSAADVPVEGALVTAVMDPFGAGDLFANAEHGPRDHFGYGRRIKARSKVNGAFVIPNIECGKCVLIIEPPLGGNMLQREFMVERSGRIDVGTIYLEESGQLVGRIEAPPQVSPCGLRVQAYMSRGRAETTTDERGSFRLPEQGALLRMEVRRSEGGGYFPWPIDEVTKSNDEVLIRLRERQTFRIQLVDSQARPLSRTRFSLRTIVENGESTWLGTWRTDTEGLATVTRPNCDSITITEIAPSCRKSVTKLLPNEALTVAILQ